jgi:hypothetical protein
MKKIDMTGWKMNEHGVSNSRWTVLREGQFKGHQRYWFCQCECGTIKEVQGGHLRDGSSISCGCINKERFLEYNHAKHIPNRILTNIIETIYALDKVAPGTANDDTLLYGCEAKYYSLKPKHNKDFSIRENMYLIGDGSGIARGLSQSAAMGLYVADSIINNLKM